MAVSGGQDSCALLHALATLQARHGLTLRVAHLNHGFRGAEAVADSEFVQSLCDSLGIPCTIETRDVPEIAHRQHISKQEAARRVRQRFLERTMGDRNADFIAYGHTADDRVETMLLNIVRGCGLDGLRSMTFVDGIRVRPLLAITRNESERYCVEHGIDFRVDASNASYVYSRNRVRAELLPNLATYYNPNIRQVLLRLSDIAGEDDEYIAKVAAEAFSNIMIERAANHVKLSCDALSSLHLALKRRIIRMAIAEMRGNLIDVSFDTVEHAINMLSGEFHKTQSINMPLGDARITVNTKEMTIERVVKASTLPFAKEISVPGVTTIEVLNIEVVTEYCSAPLELKNDRGANFVTINADEVRLPMCVRSRKAGDKMRPFGLAGTRKLQDILTDAKVPSRERNRVPIIEDTESILWVAGVAVSERCRVQSGVRNVLKVSMRVKG